VDSRSGRRTATTATEPPSPSTEPLAHPNGITTGRPILPSTDLSARQAHRGALPTSRRFSIRTTIVITSLLRDNQRCKRGRLRNRRLERNHGDLRTTPPNKGMKLTKPEHNGASQLIPGVRQTCRRRLDSHGMTATEMTATDHGRRTCWPRIAGHGSRLRNPGDGSLATEVG